jgi:hypothetical protein
VRQGSENKPDWEKLELIVAEIQKQLAPDAEVRHNHRVIGKSGRRRKLDIKVSQKISAYPVFIVFDCKRHKRPVKMKDVEAFAGQLEDVRASLGVMISDSGFDAGARAVAPQHNIILQIYREVEEADWQSLLGKKAWMPFVRMDMINPRAFVRLLERPSHEEISIDETIYSENSTEICSLRDVVGNLWIEQGQTLGEVRLAIVPDKKPLFISREENFYQVLEFSAILRFVAKKYLINLL